MTVTLRAVAATRTVQVGLNSSARARTERTAPRPRVLITLGGSVADLDRLQGSTLLANLDVAVPSPARPSLHRHDRSAAASRSSARARTGWPSPRRSRRPRRGSRRRRRLAVSQPLRGHVPPLRSDGIRGSPMSISSRRWPMRSAGRPRNAWRAPAAHRRRPGHPPLGDMFVAAITAGATSLGSTSTRASCRPALAFLAPSGGSRPASWSRPRTTRPTTTASRCSMPGLKLDDAIEEELEAVLASGELGGVGTRSWARRSTRRRGRPYARIGSGWPLIDALGSGRARRGERSGGARWVRLLAATGAQVEAIHVEPDGMNINVDSGATAPASLAASSRSAAPTSGSRSTETPTGSSRWTGAVTWSTATRCWASCAGTARARRAAGRVVVSILSNSGLQRAVEAAGGEVVARPSATSTSSTDAGLRRGPRQREVGHVIVLEHTTSGDGIVTALEVLRVMTPRGATLADLAPVPMLPEAAARARGSPQGPVGGRCGAAAAIADARRGRATRARSRPAVGHGARPAGHGRGSRR